MFSDFLDREQELVDDFFVFFGVLQAVFGSKDWSRATERLQKTRAFTVYGVREGAKYMVKVIACNVAGEGTPGFTESVFVRYPAGQQKKKETELWMFDSLLMEISSSFFFGC